MEAPKHRLTINLEPPIGSQGSAAFITEIGSAVTTKTEPNSMKRASIPYIETGLPTNMGIVGEIDVINGIMDRMRAKTKKINLDSPRTQQALTNLGIKKEECIIQYVPSIM